MKSKLLKKTNIVIVIVILTISVIISVLLNSNVFLDMDSYVVYYPSKEELNVIYSEVIERNLKMLEKPVEYGDKFCSAYVSTQKDLELHNQILSKLQNLSDEICKDAETDYEKVKLIAYWVAGNIYYNHVAAQNSVTLDTISLETVLETKTATCAGYSNMFSALCNMQGIYCVNLRGGTYSADITADFLLSAPKNHEWNAVLIDGNWIFVDTTWMSDNIYTENGYEKHDTIQEKYFDIPFEEMCYEHRIDLIDYRNFKSSINALKE